MYDKLLLLRRRNLFNTDFFILYLVAARSTLGHNLGGSLTNSILMTAFTYFNAKIIGSFVMRLDPKAR